MRRTAPISLALLTALGLAAGGPAEAGWPWGDTGKPAPSRPARASFADIGYADWTDQEPDYRFYPGDEIDISVPSAPELTKTVVVQPDGRISLSLIEPVMAADRTIAELQDALTRAYAGQLLRPRVYVAAKGTTPLKVFVGGEVGAPGVLDMPGDINALQAVIQAGGFKTSAKVDRVVIIRRAPGGRAMMRTVDLRKAMKDPARGDFVPLRRFDIIYVPRSGVAEAGLFVQQYFRDLSPIQFGFNYALGGQGVN